MRGPASHSYQPRIKWAQAHGTREALDRRFRLAEPDFLPSRRNSMPRPNWN